MPCGGAVKTVNWTASDLDGDTLSYSVLYSADNKGSWYRGGDGSHRHHLQPGHGPVAGRDEQRYVRVLATDGVNTGQGDAGPFAVSGKEPTALIDAPADGPALPRARTCSSRGTASTWRTARCPTARLPGRLTGMAPWARADHGAQRPERRASTPSP